MIRELKMKIEKIDAAAGVVKLVNTEGSPAITDAQSALDLIATVRYERGVTGIIIDKTDVAEGFVALCVLQKIPLIYKNNGHLIP